MSDTGLLRGLTLGPIPYYVKAAGVHNKTVADFAGVYNNGVEYYRKNGVKCTFDELLTHTGGLSCQWGSDGQLYWCPHNLEGWSNNVSVYGSLDASWGEKTIDPDGRNDAVKLVENSGTVSPQMQASFGIDAGRKYTIAIFAKGAGRDIIQLNYSGSDMANFDMGLGQTDLGANSASGDFSNPILRPYGNGWYLCKVDLLCTSTVAGNIRCYINPNRTIGAPSYTGDGTSGVYLWGYHVYYSDLAGMMDNPDRHDSLVYTPTSAAAYLPRRNSYYYNSTTSSWENEGIKIETRAANNILRSSMNFSDDVIDDTFWSGNTSFANIQPVLHYFSNNHNAYEHEGDGLGSRSRSQTWTSHCNTNTQYTFHVILEEVSAVNAAFGVYINGAWTEGVLCNYFWANNTVTDRNGGPSDYKGAIDLGTGPNGGRLALAYATFTSPNTVTSAGFYIYPNGVATVTTNTILHFAQLEAGNVVTSPVITPNTGQVTRSADVLSIAGADMAYSSSEMSFFAEGKLNYQEVGDSVTAYFYRWYNASTDWIASYLSTNGNSGNPKFYVRENNLTDDVSSFGSAMSGGINQPFKIAHRANTTFARAAFYGTAGTDTGASRTGIPALSANTFNFGYTGNFNGSFSCFQQTDSDWGLAGIKEISSTTVSTFVANGTIITSNTFVTEANATFRIWAEFPVTVSNGCLFEAGDSTNQGIFLGFRDSDTTPKLRLRAGDGGSIGTSTSVIDVTDFPQDGKNHEIIFDVSPSTDTIRLWIDGTLKGTNTSSASWGNDRWAGTGNGAVGRVEGTTCTGEPTNDWPTYHTDLDYYQE